MSSIRLRPALFLAVVSSAWAAGPAVPPELNGILVTGKDHRFALVGSGGGYFHWANLGETVDGWKLVDYASSDDVLVLSRDGREVAVRLRTSTVGEAESAKHIRHGAPLRPQMHPLSVSQPPTPLPYALD